MIMTVVPTSFSSHNWEYKFHRIDLIFSKSLVNKFMGIWSLQTKHFILWYSNYKQNTSIRIILQIMPESWISRQKKKTRHNPYWEI